MDEGLFERCVRNLKLHGFDVAVAEDAAEAGTIIDREIEAAAPETISFGDSMTLYATGVIDRLRRGTRYRLFDGFDTSMPRSERLEIRRRGLLADLFLTGINALTAQGSLHWIDMVGNRIAPVAFGPRRVILTAGWNKITATAEEAECRIRTVAAPRNAARHEGWKTPCIHTGHCMDCNSPDRICNTHMQMVRCYPKGRILVVLIREELGL